MRFSYNFKIHSVKLKKDTSVLIHQEVVAVDITAENLNHDDGKNTPAVVLGIHDARSGVLKNATVKTVKKSERTTIIFNTQCLYAADSDIIKLFVWDSFERMVPLTEISAKTYGDIKNDDDAVYYVSPDGNNNNDGSYAKPFKNISAAVSAAANAGDGKVKIVLRRGEHKVGAKIALNKRNSNTAFEGEDGTIITTASELPFSKFETLSADEEGRIRDSAAQEKILKIKLSDAGINDFGSRFNFDSAYKATQGYAPKSFPMVIADGEAVFDVNGAENISFENITFNSCGTQVMALKNAKISV